MSIERGALDNLVSLEWLKLSKNKIKNVHKNHFAQLHNLKYLYVLLFARRYGLLPVLKYIMSEHDLTSSLDSRIWVHQVPALHVMQGD